MLFIINIEKPTKTRLGVHLKQKTKNRVVVDNIDPYPHVRVRETIQIGDVVCRINGIEMTTAKATANLIFTSKMLSLCIERPDIRI